MVKVYFRSVKGHLVRIATLTEDQEVLVENDKGQTVKLENYQGSLKATWYQASDEDLEILSRLHQEDQDRADSTKEDQDETIQKSE